MLSDNFREYCRHQIQIAHSGVLDDIVINAGLEGFNGKLFRPPSGQKYQGQGDLFIEKLLAQVQAGDSGQAMVNDYQIEQ
jgi:hypothetical protein